MSKTNKIYNRVCGICIENDKILLIKHVPSFKMPYFWLPPGGGIEVGESLENALKREFIEETGLEIAVNELLFVNQYIESPIHAIEFFFRITIIGGNLLKGYDPELAENQQIINEIKFLSFEELQHIPQIYLHNLFWNCDKLSDIFAIKGLQSLIRTF